MKFLVEKKKFFCSANLEADLQKLKEELLREKEEKKEISEKLIGLGKKKSDKFSFKYYQKKRIGS